MARKSKQAGSGHMPLTHYERTKKFASSNYGTTTTRLSGDTQVAFGHCSLSLAPIVEEHHDDHHDSKEEEEEDTTTTIAMVTNSGHLYAKEAIYQYLLTKTQDYQDQKDAYEKQQQGEEKQQQEDAVDQHNKKRQAAFEESQKSSLYDKTKKMKTGKESALVRTSYWLPDMQPDKIEHKVRAPERPISPYSGDPLRAKDLRQVALVRNKGHDECLCAISGKPIKVADAVAYWTKDKTKPGVVVLKEVFDMTISNTKGKKSKSNEKDKEKKEKWICPLTNAKIKHTIALKSGGSGFAAHNAVQVKTYKPTIT